MQLLSVACLLSLCVKETFQQLLKEKITTRIVYQRTSNTGDTCTTADDGSGNCVTIYHCRNLIEQRNVGLLRRSLCGFEGKAPKVCCPQVDEEDYPILSPKGHASNESGLLHTTLSYGVDDKLPDADSHLSNGTQDGRKLLSPFPLDCGKSQVTFRRIVGGQESVIGAWPWMAVIYYVRRSGFTAECGGVLVTKKHVITAAHCIVSSRRGTTMRPTQLKVRLGDHDIKRDDEGTNPVDVAVKSIIKFERFELRTFQNDIAILVLKSEVNFNDHIAPICIPFDVFKQDDFSHRNAFVAGWGTLSYGGAASSTLQEVQVRIWENERCRIVFRKEVPITIANLCAGDGDKDACRGDSGGPLMVAHQNGRFYLIGIVSFGKKCAEPGVPGVYTRVTNFLDWIETNVENTF